MDPRILRSRAALGDALLALLAHRDFADLAIADIVAEASVGYATFFRHYPEKDALLVEIADSLIAELAAEMAPHLLHGDAAAAASALVMRVERDRPLFSALLLGAGDVVRRTIVDRAMQMSLASNAGVQVGDLPRELTVRHMVSTALTILTWWLTEPQEKDVEQLRSIIRRLVIDPVAVTPKAVKPR